MTRFSGKFFFFYIVLVLAGMTVANYFSAGYIEDLLLTNARQSLQEKWIDSYPSLQGLDMSVQRRSYLRDRLMKLQKGGPFQLALYDLSGQLIAETDPSIGQSNKSLAPDVDHALREGQAFALLPLGSAEPHWLYFARLTEDAVFRVGLSTDGIYATLNRIWLFLWAVTAILLGISCLFYFLLTRRADVALRRFKGMIQGLEAGNFSQRIPVGDDEVGEIGQSMNSLARELELKIRALAEERNRLKTVLDSMQEGVIVLDGRGKIALFNPAMRELFNLAEMDIGRQPIEVIRNADLQTIVDQALSGSAVEKRELRVLQEGRERHLMVQATSFAEDTPARGAVVVMYDITHLRRLERVRRDFVANVSHELKTPLTSIGGYVEMLLDGAWSDSEQAKTFLGVIDANTRRLGKIVEDLLRLSEIESQTFILKSDSFKAQGLFAEVVDIHDSLLRKKNMSLEIKIEPESLVLQADRHALLHVLNNLVENAIKYGYSNTPIRLECFASGETVEFQVEDRGIGIAKPHLGRIFERFYRVDKARSKQEGGTGLGLAIVKHLVQLMGGEIEVESTPEVGSTFRLRVPGLLAHPNSKSA